MFVCHRSAGWSQDHVRSDCKPHVIYDVTSCTGCLFGVSDVQPGCAAAWTAIQGPSGTSEWRIIQPWIRERQLHLRHISCTINRIFVNRLFGKSWFWGGGILLWERHVISSVLCSVITSEVTQVVSLSSSFETFFEIRNPVSRCVQDVLPAAIS